MNIGRILLLIAATLAVSGCKDPIEEAVKRNLLDGESAQFRDISKCRDDPSIHRGEVNSKNSMGGYAGFAVFFYDGIFVYFLDGDLRDDEEVSEIMRRCYGKNLISEAAPKR